MRVFSLIGDARRAIEHRGQEWVRKVGLGEIVYRRLKFLSRTRLGRVDHPQRRLSKHLVQTASHSTQPVESPLFLVGTSLLASSLASAAGDSVNIKEISTVTRIAEQDERNQIRAVLVEKQPHHRLSPPKRRLARRHLYLPARRRHLILYKDGPFSKRP